MNIKVIKKLALVLLTSILLIGLIIPTNVKAMNRKISEDKEIVNVIDDLGENANIIKNILDDDNINKYKIKEPYSSEKETKTTIEVKDENNTNSKYKNYVALGDSIGEGYRLETKSKRYADIIKDSYNVNEYYNLALSEMKTIEFAEYIKQYEEPIKNADLITISIGSNEVLQTLIEKALETVEADNISEIGNKALIKLLQNLVAISYASDSPDDVLRDFTNYIQSAFDILDEFMVKFDNTDTFNATVNQYITYWNTSMKYIRDINPNAKIVVTEFYNPYYKYTALRGEDEISQKINGYLDRIKTLGDEYMSRFNTELYNYSSKYNYAIAEIEDEFNKGNYLNVSIDLSSYDVQEIIEGANKELQQDCDLIKYFNSLDFSKLDFDPHPNEEGHKLIAEKIKEKINQSSTVGSVFGNGSIWIICGIVVVVAVVGSIVYVRKKK